MENKTKKRLTAYEDTNMYGGAHCTNYEVALRAYKEGRGLIVHGSHYDGQRYHYYKLVVDNLTIDADGNIYGIDDRGERWEATRDLCKYARTGQF